MTLTDQDNADLTDLMARPGFRRFVFRVIQNAGIFSATANGSDQRTFYENGRRSLGLDILREVDAAQPVPGPSGIPTLTLIQVLREEAQSQPPERTNRGRRNDPYSDIRPDGPDAEPGAE
jgi:hypothetical protein